MTVNQPLLALLLVCLCCLSTNARPTSKIANATLSDIQKTTDYDEWFTRVQTLNYNSPANPGPAFETTVLLDQFPFPTTLNQIQFRLEYIDRFLSTTPFFLRCNVYVAVVHKPYNSPAPSFNTGLSAPFTNDRANVIIGSTFLLNTERVNERDDGIIVHAIYGAGKTTFEWDVKRDLDTPIDILAGDDIRLLIRRDCPDSGSPNALGFRLFGHYALL